MRGYAQNSITLMQFIFLIHGIQVATGVMSLPRELWEKAGTDGWMSLIAGWFINILAGYLIIQVFKRYPDFTLFDLFDKLFGKRLSLLISIPIAIYFTFFAWLIQIKTMLFIKSWFLPQTSDTIIIALFSIPTYMLARKGLRVLGRYGELVFYMTAWMPLILLLVLNNSHWIHLLPLFKEGVMPVLKGVETTTYSLLGFEILFVLYPYLENKKKAMLGVVIANSITILLYLAVTLICFAFFSPDEIGGYNQPLLSMLKVIEFRFLERFDMIILAIYIYVISSTWIPYLYFASFSIAHVLRRQNHSPIITWLVVLLIIIVFVLHPSWNQSNVWQAWMSRYGMMVAYALPVMLWIYVQGNARVNKGESQ
ncbi:GerAB/ArcD/ProY family transporter [Cohnella cholangitidis]|uniref:GerAB/ArcD/ProY family transporter n=1 Tax=Cohnella cholangitidis TaxID=2598458 RepID=A0A7G5BUU6_9BACL|nr:endospore germination permease [Cohnella cholangitidis]QMV40730.1 GerAB/ArcD/ProY family transporter [Cohnella cholangitidis]